MFSNCPDMISMPGRFLTVPDSPNDYTKELKKLERNMNLLEKKQRVLDKEQQLIEREEYLAKKQEQLKEYEQDVDMVEAMLDKRQALVDKRAKDVELLNDVDMVEAMLDKRQALVDKRAKDVELLNDDLLTLKHDLAESAEHIEDDSNTVLSSTDDVMEETPNSPEASTKARRHWSLARKHLLDKMTLLEATVQRYRTQLASTSATITAKDMMIARLNKELAYMEDEMRLKDRKLKQMESQLSITLEEKTRSEKIFEMFMEELQTIDFSSSLKTIAMQRSPVHSPSKPQHMSLRQRILKKNKSAVFDFNTEGDKRTASPAKERPRAHSSPGKRVVNHADTNGDSNHEHVQNSDMPENNAQHDGELARTHFNNVSKDKDMSETGSKACVVM